MDKKELWFGILGSIIFIGLAVVLTGKYLSQINQAKVIAPVSSNQPDASPTKLTTQEVAKHNSSADCWMMINNTVYDVTDYAARHPDGAKDIYAYCGKDATQAFTNIKGGRGHSSQANEEHKLLEVGKITK